MYTYETKDCEILFNALTNYKEELEEEMKNDKLPLESMQYNTQEIERIQQILEEL